MHTATVRTRTPLWNCNGDTTSRTYPILLQRAIDGAQQLLALQRKATHLSQAVACTGRRQAEWRKPIGPSRHAENVRDAQKQRLCRGTKVRDGNLLDRRVR